MDSNATPLPAVWLPTAYLAPVSYYCKLYASRQAYVDGWEHYVKQTYRNRCIIASPHGRQALTVPIERNDPSHTAVRDIRLSNHGNWRHLHWQALVTAYDASPYFEYYADDLRPVLERPSTAAPSSAPKTSGKTPRSGLCPTTRCSSRATASCPT